MATTNITSTIQVEQLENIGDSVASKIFAVTQQIPEFEAAYPPSEYFGRMNGKKCLIQFAVLDQAIVGFKLGYEKTPTLFYSWMGGVLPHYRKMGVAKMLAKQQEQWAKQQGYTYIGMKTRNYLKNMLHFALSNDFYITDIETHPEPLNNRILLEKRLI